MQASGVFTGKIDLNAALSTADTAGVTVRQAMIDLGMPYETDDFEAGPLPCPGGLSLAVDVRIERRFAHTWKGYTCQPDGVALGGSRIHPRRRPDGRGRRAHRRGGADGGEPVRLSRPHTPAVRTMFDQVSARISIPAVIRSGRPNGSLRH